MTPLSRRDFLLQSSASLFLLTSDSRAKTGNILPSSTSADFDSEAWQRFGRLRLTQQDDSVILQDGFLASRQAWRNVDFSFAARAPRNVDQVQIWAGIRCRDRDSRYVFGLRGGNNDDIYLARYAPDGGARFLGIAPLDFHPEPGQWYSIRAVARENRFQIYLGQDKLPRISVEDTEPLWHEGEIFLGGGWLPAEFRQVHPRSITADDETALVAAGSRVYSFGSFDAEQKRVRQRAAYQGRQVVSIDLLRAEISLDGNWLFLPDQEQRQSGRPEAIDCDDRDWHILGVPDFWTPTLTWLHAETGFPHLEGVSAGKGLSDRLYEAELDRLNGCSFPWRETKSAWYRHHVELPEDIAGRHVELCFDAVAKACEIWVNGARVGAHIGMFGEVRCNITSAVKPGANLIAVHVHGRLDTEDFSTAIVGIAVTVPVTASMLHSLPHGMYPENASGIWQGVRLIVTNPVAVEETFIEPGLDRLSFQLKMRNATPKTVDALIGFSICSVKDGTVLYASSPQSAQKIETTGAALYFTTPTLKAELWSPQSPNLYVLEITVIVDGVVVDRMSTRFGFRTFKVDGDKLLLNGKPLWLRGANHFPHALRPNDKLLASRFMQMARDGNVVATRSHTAPFSTTWLDAADDAGMCVSYEGTWPWLMLQGEPPEENLLRIWKEEFASLIKKHRNHPSVICWTVNNEMKFEAFDRKNPDRLRKKWTILSDMVKTIRSIDPTRPVVCDSSYCREEVAAEYENLIRPEGFDDGDIDDAHRYYGWYDPSFFHVFHGEFGRKASWPGRPLISQEMATGYPRNDDGHPARFYLFKHYTPQSLVGDEAYEHRDPAIFLSRQAFITKELAEAIRRTNRDTCAGIFHFAYVTWFRDVWSAEKIQPFVTYHALKKALQPVLVSAELYGRHFYAGQQIRTRVCIVNDSESGDALPSCTLLWELLAGTEAIARGELPVSDLPYYCNRWIDVSLPVPENLPASRVDGSLRLRLIKKDVVLSDNDYDVTLATRAWAEQGLSEIGNVALLDPFGEAPRGLRNLKLKQVSSVQQLMKGQQLVVAGAEKVLAAQELADGIDQFVREGGRALLLNPRTKLAEHYPSLVAQYRVCDGQIVGMQIPESRVFSEIEPLDLSWFERGAGNIPLACSGVYQVNRQPEITCLASTVDIHGYLRTPEEVVRVSGSPLVELRAGKGTILASEMLVEADFRDPIAGRLLSNLIHHLRDVGNRSEG
jgi:Glycosyl hydrolases family 2, TIM barrel domain/Glycosyl hydrolases family 2/Glycosyl hydrolases family 2, sugar binding domain